MSFTLRPYQLEALQKIDAVEAQGVRAQLGVAATGLGKTIIFVTLAKQRNCATLILAHRDELVQQAADKVRQIWPEVELGIVKAEQNDIQAKVVIASVQTLARPSRLEQLRVARTPGSETAFRLIIVDEAHHSVAPTYQAILEELHAGEDEGPLLLGVTATPERGDKLGLHTIYERIAFNYDIEWGIRMGYLCDLRALLVRLNEFDLSDVGISHGDYAQGEAGRLLTAANAPEHIAQAWCDLASDRKTLIFTATVELARLVQEQFLARGIPAGMVHGGTPLEERRHTLAEFSAGRLRIIANCAVLTEGYDEPSIDCIVIARPTRSASFYTQMIGRGTRRHPEKKDCLIIDVVGATVEHDLVTAASLFGLEADPNATNGQQTFTAMLDAKEAELLRLGQLEAERVELFKAFHEQMSEASIVWAQAHLVTEGMRQYIRPLGQGQPVVILRQVHTDSDTWAAFVTNSTDLDVLIDQVPLVTAQATAEDYVRRHVKHQAFIRTGAAWRDLAPTSKQLDAARNWGMPRPDQHKTRGELSNALDLHIALKIERGRKGLKRF
jgi:superfamily II DNA or RNA helicase